MEKSATVRAEGGTPADVERLYCEAAIVRSQLRGMAEGLSSSEGPGSWRRAKLSKADALARQAQERLAVGQAIPSPETLAEVRDLINAAKRHCAEAG